MGVGWLAQIWGLSASGAWPRGARERRSHVLCRSLVCSKMWLWACSLVELKLLKTFASGFALLNLVSRVSHLPAPWKQGCALRLISRASLSDVNFCKDHRDRTEVPDLLAEEELISYKLKNRRKLARLITQYRSFWRQAFLIQGVTENDSGLKRYKFEIWEIRYNKWKDK